MFKWILNCDVVGIINDCGVFEFWGNLLLVRDGAVRYLHYNK